MDHTGYDVEEPPPAHLYDPKRPLLMSRTPRSDGRVDKHRLHELKYSQVVIAFALAGIASSIIATPWLTSDAVYQMLLLPCCSACKSSGRYLAEVSGDFASGVLVSDAVLSSPADKLPPLLQRFVKAAQWMWMVAPVGMGILLVAPHGSRRGVLGCVAASAGGFAFGAAGLASVALLSATVPTCCAQDPCITEPRQRAWTIAAAVLLLVFALLGSLFSAFTTWLRWLCAIVGVKPSFEPVDTSEYDLEAEGPSTGTREALSERLRAVMPLGPDLQQLRSAMRDGKIPITPPPGSPEPLRFSDDTERADYLELEVECLRGQLIVSATALESEINRLHSAEIQQQEEMMRLRTATMTAETRYEQEVERFRAEGAATRASRDDERIKQQQQEIEKLRAKLAIVFERSRGSPPPISPPSPTAGSSPKPLRAGLPHQLSRSITWGGSANPIAAVAKAKLLAEGVGAEEEQQSTSPVSGPEDSPPQAPDAMAWWKKAFAKPENSDSSPTEADRKARFAREMNDSGTQTDWRRPFDDFGGAETTEATAIRNEKTSEHFDIPDRSPKPALPLITQSTEPRGSTTLGVQTYLSGSSPYSGSNPPRSWRPQPKRTHDIACQYQRPRSNKPLRPEPEKTTCDVGTQSFIPVALKPSSASKAMVKVSTKDAGCGPGPYQWSNGNTSSSTSVTTALSMKTPSLYRSPQYSPRLPRVTLVFYNARTQHSAQPTPRRLTRSAACGAASVDAMEPTSFYAPLPGVIEFYVRLRTADPPSLTGPGWRAPLQKATGYSSRRSIIWPTAALDFERVVGRDVEQQHSRLLELEVVVPGNYTYSGNSINPTLDTTSHVLNLETIKIRQAEANGTSRINIPLNTLPRIGLEQAIAELRPRPPPAPPPPPPPPPAALPPATALPPIDSGPTTTALVTEARVFAAAPAATLPASVYVGAAPAAANLPLASAWCPDSSAPGQASRATSVRSRVSGETHSSTSGRSTPTSPLDSPLLSPTDHPRKLPQITTPSPLTPIMASPPPLPLNAPSDRRIVVVNIQATGTGSLGSADSCRVMISAIELNV